MLILIEVKGIESIYGINQRPFKIITWVSPNGVLLGRFVSQEQYGNTSGSYKI